MLSYRHAFHAGNHADVHKHIVLVQLTRYLPQGFTNFKIEGRGLGSAIVLEFLLYYLVKPEHQLEVREEIYLDNMLDLF